MSKNNIYIEENRLCEESKCKYQKRLIVGLIKFIESGQQDANIPEHYFDNIADNMGFEYHHSEDENGNDVRCFRISNNWQFGKDDCGGEEHGHPDKIMYSLKPEENKVSHLRLVPKYGE